MANKIYAGTTSGSEVISAQKYNENQINNTAGAYYKHDRIYLLSNKVDKDFNTYKYWETFPLALPKIWDDNGKLTTVKHPQGTGIKSLFSNVAAVFCGEATMRRALNQPLIDSPSSREEIRARTDCSISALVKASEMGKMGRATYQYSDFMYCKYLGKVPNNYMITLRKFPLPCGDHINYTDDGEYASKDNYHLPDMGRLVTWLGTPGNEMSNILSYTMKMPWDEITAPFDESQSSSQSGAKGGGTFGQFLSALDGTYGREIAKTGGYGYSGEDNWIATSLGFSSAGGVSRNADLSNSNRIVADRQNVIAKVIAPGGKKDGLSFDQDISLTFDYELRSYNGINGRAAMVDLLANILMVTYLQGKFFPGSHRAVGQSTSNLYSNLPIFKDPEAIKSPGNFMNSLFTSVKQIAAELGFGKGQSPKEALKKIGNNIFEMLASGLINQMGRPQMFAMTSFISPQSTGNWHLTIGNPRNPILTIGNLILESSKVEHYGPLGLDDFPTGLRVTVSLKHAKPRDSVAIEQMYMQGNYRIYAPMGDEHIRLMYENSKETGKIDSNKIDQLNKYNEIEINGKKKAVPIVSANDIANKRYMKFFGTNDLKGISITAGEAFVGSVKSKESKDSK